MNVPRKGKEAFDREDIYLFKPFLKVERGIFFLVAPSPRSSAGTQPGGSVPLPAAIPFQPIQARLGGSEQTNNQTLFYQSHRLQPPIAGAGKQSL